MNTAEFFGKRFEIISVLGKGGMAHVYEAYDHQQKKHVAVKKLSKAFTKKHEAFQRLKREGEILQSLSHPSILVLDSIEENDEGIFLVMEKLEGKTLAARLKHQGPLNIEETNLLLDCLCGALGLAHQQNILHRDLKPENIFITESNVKLLDFGISKAFDAEKLTQTGQAIGTPKYMAPELFNGKEANIQTETYALGATLYECLTGTPLFPGSFGGPMLTAILSNQYIPLRSHKHQYSEAMEQMLAKSIALNPENRFQNIESFHTAWVGVQSPFFDKTTPSESEKSNTPMRTLFMGYQATSLPPDTVTPRGLPQTPAGVGLQIPGLEKVKWNTLSSNPEAPKHPEPLSAVLVPHNTRPPTSSSAPTHGKNHAKKALHPVEDNDSIHVPVRKGAKSLFPSKLSVPRIFTSPFFWPALIGFVLGSVITAIALFLIK